MIGKGVSLDSEFFGKKSAIIAKSGGGKSYTARVIVEEGRKLGATFVIIDPQDAYNNLPNFEYIEAANVKDAGKLGILVAKTNRNVVIQVRSLAIGEQAEFVKKFLKSYRQHQLKGIKTIVIDEIHKFAPEGTKTAASDYVVGLFQEDRSMGLGAIAITQRPQRMSKTILAQADVNFTGRLTAMRDLQAVQTYLDSKDDILKIKRLKQGEFFVTGLRDEPFLVQIRKAETQHSGNSPKHLLTENSQIFSKHLKSVYKVDKKMSNNVNTAKEPVKEIIPSKAGLIDLAGIGAKMSLGSAISGTVGFAAQTYIKSPIPVVSSRTLAAGVSSLVMYAGYRKISNATIKETLKYGTAGSVVFTAGSLFYDILEVSGVKLPNIVNGFIGMATGVKSMNAQSGKKVDIEAM